MSRRRIIVIVGLGLLIALFYYDRANRVDRIVAAEVIGIEDQDNEAGPDSWHVTARVEGVDIALEPLEKRPDLTLGQTTCVTEIIRNGAAPEYRWAPSASC